MALAIDPSTTMLPPSSAVYPPPPPSPLFERRRRAATISTLPSPLTVITSSLSGWARDDLVTARMVPRTQPSPPSQVPTMQLMTEDDNWTRNVPPILHETFASTIPETDMDCTPRVPAFPQNLQNTGMPAHVINPPVEFPVPEPQQDGLPVPLLDPYDITADLESYSLGLRQFGIGNGGAEAVNYGVPPFEVDYNCLFSSDSAREQA
ncbi:hypothetical protein OH77DRAFT_1425155 [Trametes cingulata]|nr:hypothetical protein OH77DRAFT_1425155 [Trametes cingulata]